MRISREELKRLLRQFPLVEERHLFSSGFPECGDSYVDSNLDACVWLLDNSELVLQALNNYDRIINLVQEDIDSEWYMILDRDYITLTPDPYDE